MSKPECIKQFNEWIDKSERTEEQLLVSARACMVSSYHEGLQDGIRKTKIRLLNMCLDVVTGDKQKKMSMGSILLELLDEPESI